ncbi:MAG TPA: glutamine synthetase type III, partial [Desulfovibrio sp.]|nr:glutamine synthetase type III [Desulfovibrio sp.]
MSLARDEALFKATDASPVSKPREAWESADDIYGKYVFTLDMMRKRLPKEVYKELESIVNKGGRLNPEIADVVASAMKDWAIEMGATHYTHWFQPMT